MNLLSLPQPVQQLARLGSQGILDTEDFLDYRSMGIKPEHTPALMEVIQQAGEFWENENEVPESWLPVHTWRALSQLRAVEALPLLTGLLRRTDDEAYDLITEDLPRVLGRFGPPALPALIELLHDQAAETWARINAGEAIQITGMLFPETRDEAVRALTRALESYATQDALLNALLVDFLLGLGDVEAAPLVQQAYASGQIDESILGDFEDYQVAAGLLEKRQTPRDFLSLPEEAFTDGLTMEDLIGVTHKTGHKEDKKAKQQRKQAKESRKKNRKKKKK